MKYVSWNINGIRAVQKKGFLDWLEQEQPDVLGIQEIKARPDQLDEEMLAARGYHVAWNPATRPGYSGVATFSKKKPKSVQTGFGIERFDDEGRVVVTQHNSVFFYNIYFPNGGKDDDRLKYKLDFYAALREHVQERVAAGEKIIVAGDWNTSHKEIDLARPKANRDKSGFMPIECAEIDRWIDEGWVDSFRKVAGDIPEQYSWWSFRAGARERNVGWRLDYHFVSPTLAKRIKTAGIMPEVMGSDHCPVFLEIK